jgi:hypothetical protein
MSGAWPVEDLDPDASLDHNARRILAVRIAEYFSYSAVVAIEAAVEEHHNLRIAAKRLRYTLELFADVFGDEGERQTRRVKAVQEVLGELHDHDVRIGLILDQLKRTSVAALNTLSDALAIAAPEEHAGQIAAFLRPLPTDPQRGLLAYLGREHARRRGRYQAFLALWNESHEGGMREDLIALSRPPVPAAGRGEPKRDNHGPA